MQDRIQELGWSYHEIRPLILKEDPVYRARHKKTHNSRVNFAPYVSKGISDACKVLYISHDAPKEVVDAAYKVMMSMNHPDKGGDAEMCVKINNAKDFIYKERGW